MFTVEREVGLNVGPTLLFEGQSGDVGLGVHSRSAGQGSHGGGRSVLRRALADDHVADFLRDSMVGFSGSSDDRFEGQVGLPLGCYTEYEGVCFCELEFTADGFDFCCFDSVSW